jgi:hypothetical protein
MSQILLMFTNFAYKTCGFLPGGELVVGLFDVHFKLCIKPKNSNPTFSVQLPEVRLEQSAIKRYNRT